ncbi:lipopolysaccharide export system ATP-binding protein LptB [Acidithrix ferrooxidans]|uniref:Lipopolysaccharide export system ATP-binding protein LptB n=2 Tax=Acidithrix ferrooxidans TaxID=1280514 RepID=A0A0D8HL28_9ACTN|nr:lipopolysaccharide export system ATP-binding protein LptB [Acidithrix ferrooxidans]
MMSNSIMENSTLIADEVTVRFGGLVALDRVSLNANLGEVHGVIGPNGAGKTTLFNVLCGFVKPSSGKLTYFGNEVKTLRPEQLSKMGVSRTLQGLGLFSRMTVLENVMIGGTSLTKVGPFRSLLGAGATVTEEARIKDLALSVIADLGLSPFTKRLPPSLPYAIQKKVALARALVLSPKFILLDEPASGLSNVEMDELGDLILGLSKNLGVLLVEHHMDLVMRVCSTITVLDFGRVIANGNPSEIRANPIVTQAYLGEDVTI